MLLECEKCHELNPCNCPTEITAKDIDDFFSKLMNDDFDIKIRPCWKCSKDFFPNYHNAECDECYFSRFPKEEVEAFYRSFF